MQASCTPTCPRWPQFREPVPPSPYCRGFQRLGGPAVGQGHVRDIPTCCSEKAPTRAATNAPNECTFGGGHGHVHDLIDRLAADVKRTGYTRRNLQTCNVPTSSVCYCCPSACTRHTARIGRASIDRPACAGHAVCRPHGRHGRRINGGRRLLGVGSAGPTFQHRLAFIASGNLAQAGGNLETLVQQPAAWRNRRGDRQCRSRHRNLCIGGGTDGACRSLAAETSVLFASLIGIFFPGEPSSGRRWLRRSSSLADWC